ncbi:MAG TPA: enoyl-CoA hydratase family protein [Nocardioidaceae bacterium]|nr:enoyl-CoA hydratase family protein [Nocardioidaceae bacterium]
MCCVTELVRLETADGTATITLDSPHNRNALSRALVSQLSQALDDSAADDTAKVVVLRSSGRVFCSGADMSEAATIGMEEGSRGLIALLRQIVAHPKPVLAVLAGPVRAGGIGIIGACDVVVAAQEATFAFTEARLGLAPAAISLTTRARMTDRAASLTYLSGDTFDAVEAARIGLVTEAVGADDLESTVESVVASIAKSTGQGLRETKRLLNAPLLADIDERGDDLAAMSARLFGSEEAREAMRAFLEKRSR